MSVNSKMTAIADEVRELSGTSNKMGLDEITANLKGTNTEIDSQTNLIAQIQTALEDKASSGGGITLPTLTNPGVAENLEEGYELIDADGNVVVGTDVCESGGGSDEDYGYTYLEHNLPEEIGMMVANGVECYSGAVTKVPFDMYGCISFYFLAFGNDGLYSAEDIHYEYQTEGDDGMYTETMGCNWSNPMGTPYISGFIYDGQVDKITLVITFS
jgi:hypothetical protein